jgi:hypothetical protein
VSLAIVRAVDRRCGQHLVAPNDAALAAVVAAHATARHPTRARADPHAEERRRAWIAARGYWELAPALRTDRDEPR